MTSEGTDHFDYDLYQASVSGTVLERIFHYRRMHEVTGFASLRGEVLDYGCNTGAFLVPLRARGIKIEGYDISAPNVERARENLEGRGLKTQVYLETLPKRTWTSILLLNVLEYATDKPALVAHLMEHLAPGGWVTVAVANSTHPFIQSARLRSVLSGRDANDVQRAEPAHNLTDKTVREIFLGAGMELLGVRHGLAWINRYYLFKDPRAARTH